MIIINQVLLWLLIFCFGLMYGNASPLWAGIAFTAQTIQMKPFHLSQIRIFYLYIIEKLNSHFLYNSKFKERERERET